MKCAICRNGETQKGYSTVVFEKGETTLIFKQVPSEICDNCGEEYISAEVNRSLLKQARNEANRGITLEMVNYAA